MFSDAYLMILICYVYSNVFHWTTLFILFYHFVLSDEYCPNVMVSGSYIPVSILFCMTCCFLILSLYVQSIWFSSLHSVCRSSLFPIIMIMPWLWTLLYLNCPKSNASVFLPIFCSGNNRWKKKAWTKFWVGTINV